MSVPPITNALLHEEGRIGIGQPNYRSQRSARSGGVPIHPAPLRAPLKQALRGQLEISREIMAKTQPVPANIDEYIAAAAPAARPLLREIRRVVRAAAPDAEELISYRMPAFRQHGILLYFGAFKHHIGVFPPVSGDARLEQALEPYAGAKGNLRFPMDRPVPYALIRRIVKLKLKQNLARASAESTRKPLRGPTQHNRRLN